MNLLEIFILAIFLIILALAFKNEFYSTSYDEKFTNENKNKVNENSAIKNNYKVYPYGPQNYFYNWGWYPYRGLWPYYNPWWYYPNPYPQPIS